MTTQDIAAALRRVESILRRRPETGSQEDEPATASWDGGTRVVTRNLNGARVLTDMPCPLGGNGDQVTPGWLLRAGLASCAVTRIAMSAAAAGIELKSLEVVASSRSDARGLLDMVVADGETVPIAPYDVRLLFRISADGASPQRLRALVEAGCRLSPASRAMQEAVPIALRIEIEGR
jgi:uncharacterized OsmC-like protein